jgi:hypothetical protein
MAGVVTIQTLRVRDGLLGLMAAAVLRGNTIDDHPIPRRSGAQAAVAEDTSVMMWSEEEGGGLSKAAGIRRGLMGSNVTSSVRTWISQERERGFFVAPRRNHPWAV